jgi:hypothetical protein
MNWHEAVRKSPHHIAILKYEKEFIIRTFHLYGNVNVLDGHIRYSSKPHCTVQIRAGEHLLEEREAEPEEWQGFDRWVPYMGEFHTKNNFYLPEELFIVE